METLYTQLKIRTDYNLHSSYVSKNMHNVLHNLRHPTTFQLYATGGKKRFEQEEKYKTWNVIWSKDYVYKVPKKDHGRLISEENFLIRWKWLKMKTHLTYDASKKMTHFFLFSLNVCRDR